MKSCTYSDYMIYSPEVPILKDELGVYLDDFKKVSIITAPAVNANIVKQRESELIPQIETIKK